MPKAHEINKKDIIRYAGDAYVVENVRHGEIYSFITIDGETVRYKRDSDVQIIGKV